ncbi:MAG TPA: DUF5047 domain-containing protein [Trueperaceae bacterium]
MRPVSARFLRAVRDSHPMNARARVVAPGQIGTDPDGVEIGIHDGAVELNATADVRATLELTTPGRGMWPDRRNPLLAPYGNEVFVERGVQFGGGVVEWCSLGYFRIDTPSQEEVPDGLITLACSDRMSTIVDSDLTQPRQYTSAMTFGAVVADLIGDVYPWAQIEWDDATETQPIGRDILVEEKRYEALKDLATSVGKIMYFDHRGVLVIRTAPDPTQPVWDITHGEDGVLVQASRELTRVGVKNGWVVTGETADTDNAVHVVVVDNDPASPTYWHGSFGKVPGRHSSPLITDPGRAFAAGRQLLRQSIGLPYTVSFGAVPNPALEPWDPIRVSYSDTHGREYHVIEQLSIPLTAGETMTGRTRQQSLVIVGGAT